MNFKRIFRGIGRIAKEKCSMFVFGLLPISRNRVMLMSHYGKQVNCNPYAIYEKLKTAPEKYEFVWVDNSHRTVEKSVKYRSVRFYYYLRTSRYLIFNARPNMDVQKRKGQFYIQTWHSSLGFKMIERDAEETLDAKYVKNAKKDSAYIDLLISGCRFRTDCFRRNFWYDGEIAEIGTPRNDVLFSADKDSIAENTKSRLGIERDAKIVLYAPTFRNSGNLSYATSFDADGLLKALQKRYSCKWTLVCRLHPNVVCDDIFPEGTVNASKYEDMQALLLAADFLITDYSSVMFDYMLLSKPCVLYCPDYEEYTRNERKTYFSVSELPFPMAVTNEELQTAVCELDESKYLAALNDFKRSIGSFEQGVACERIVSIMAKRNR